MPRIRNALVTGASAGIGRELVRQLVLDRGCHILATARRLDRLEELARELPEGQVRVLAGDLADADFRATLWDHAEAMPGGCDLLINNAAFGHYAEFAEEDPATIDRMIAVNVMAVLDLTRRAIGPMKARGSGQVCQISSTLGFVGLPYSATYVATKHAINGLVKSLRDELQGTGVRVWAACPNRTASEFHGVALDRAGDAPSIRSAYADPTDRVARGILRGIDSRRTFIYPSFSAWLVPFVAWALPWPYEWFMGRWAPRHFREEMERGRS
ncbi:MAG: SDR family NAD(P)-dependent oxidoreductase [Isosphaeraceae bacterium]